MKAKELLQKQPNLSQRQRCLCIWHLRMILVKSALKGKVAAGKEYACKMHSKTKGRIDGLTNFYKDNTLEKGDICILDYDIAQKRIVCTIRKKEQGTVSQG